MISRSTCLTRKVVHQFRKLQYENPNRIKVGTPAVTEDGQIYVINVVENELVSLSTKDGSKNWSVAVNGNVNKTVTVGDDGTIYLVGSGNVHALQKSLVCPRIILANVPTEPPKQWQCIHDGKEGELKSKPQTGFVQHLITDQIPEVTNILAEDIDQDGDMDIITTAKGGIGILQHDGSPLLKARSGHQVQIRQSAPIRTTAEFQQRS